MSLEKAQIFYKEKRKEFREVLDKTSNEINEFIKNALSECCGSFDEQTLAENLREEFAMYKKDLL